LRVEGSVILENVSHASAKRWERFVVSLKMDEPIGPEMLGACLGFWEKCRW
jgi:hypothetical protein